MKTDDIRRAIAKGHPINARVVAQLCDDYDKARALLRPARDRIEALEITADTAQATNRDLWRNRNRLLWMSMLGAAVVAGVAGAFGGFVFGFAVGGG